MAHEYWNIESCPRCGATHEAVEVQELQAAPIEANGREYDYFGFCPTTAAPLVGRKILNVITGVVTMSTI